MITIKIAGLNVGIDNKHRYIERLAQDYLTEAKADFIKTSTGFSNGGATVEDIELFSRHIFGNTKIKAAGGIKTLRDAEMLLKAGASRLGTSRIVALVKEEREAKL